MNVVYRMSDVLDSLLPFEIIIGDSHASATLKSAQDTARHPIRCITHNDSRMQMSKFTLIRIRKSTHIIGGVKQRHVVVNCIHHGQLTFYRNSIQM